MKLKTLIQFAAMSFCGVWSPLAAQGNQITLGGPLPTQRVATLDGATAGFTGTGNATVTDVESYLGALTDWTEQGSVEGDSGGVGAYTQGLLTVVLKEGSWGDKPTSGTWTINDPDYWDKYGTAAISLHVGGGGSEVSKKVDAAVKKDAKLEPKKADAGAKEVPGAGPDHFVWLIEQGALTGTWSYDGSGLKGGGLSNLKLYSSGTSGNVPGVPDAGSTLVLLGLAAIGLSATGRGRKVV